MYLLSGLLEEAGVIPGRYRENMQTPLQPWSKPFCRVSLLTTAPLCLLSHLQIACTFQFGEMLQHFSSVVSKK